MQIGTPEQLFETPAHRFVGHFIGSPGMNFLACEWDCGRGDDRRSARRDEQHAGAAGRRGACRSACGRSISSSQSTPGPNRVPARVAAIRDQGIADDGATGSRCVARLGEAAQLAPMPRAPAPRSRACRLRAARSTPTNGECRELGEAGQSARLVVRAAGADQRGVLGADSADDDRQLLRAGHPRPGPGRVRRHGVVQGRCCATRSCTARSTGS